MPTNQYTEFINGAIPFGIIFGTLAESSGLSIWGAMAMSFFVYAGSSQFIAVGLLATGVGPAIIIATTLVVGLMSFVLFKWMIM